jgi:hypothetical protein
MQEDSNYWEVDCGDQGVFKISDGQKNAILLAEKQKVRFVDIGEAVINVAFIRIMRKRKTENHRLVEPEKPAFEPTESGKRLIEDLRKKMHV